ncbi:hypothetical protein VWV82_002981 [Cronobacter malonaticus]|jgi:hypothetical protein|nr:MULTISPECIES: hypothetical protein [Enterobacteriaceae]EMD9274376.1 hypothetical protein [Cronobacter malonaticus]KIU60150.1 hypothetical protein CRSA0334_17745 [Cronobacter malonaticus ENBT0334]MDY0888307.1 hypothetical protein [Kosakonia sp. CFBP8986]
MKRTEISLPMAPPVPLSSTEVTLLKAALSTVREEVTDCPYIHEAMRVLPVKGYRSAITAYWNAVIDDLRKKIMHRSLDLFNKECKQRKEIKTYEDFQDHVIDFDLIDGAFKIGVIDREGHKLLHQARETRNLFGGHPQSSEPDLIKVINLINDCNRYVLSQEYPPSIIDISTYLSDMDSADFNKNDLAVKQAFSSLPAVYKTELSNRFFGTYCSANISSELRSNIEFCAPILWVLLPKEDKSKVGQQFDKYLLSGNNNKIEKAQQFILLVDGLMYISPASRKVIIEPLINLLSDSLDSWAEEEKYTIALLPFSGFIPEDNVLEFVSAITKTYVGRTGSSYNYSRKNFYSNGAAPLILEMFEHFDINKVSAFVETIKNDSTLRHRIQDEGQFLRLQKLGNLLLEESTYAPTDKAFLKALVDKSKPKEAFLKSLPKNPSR